MVNGARFLWLGFKNIKIDTFSLHSPQVILHTKIAAPSSKYNLAILKRMTLPFERSTKNIKIDKLISNPNTLFYL